MVIFNSYVSLPEGISKYLNQLTLVGLFEAMPVGQGVFRATKPFPKLQHGGMTSNDARNTPEKC